MAIKKRTSKSKSRNYQLRNVLVVMLIVGSIGVYSLLSTYAARQTNTPDTYIEYASGSHRNIVNKSNMGDVITPTVRDKSLQTPSEKREKIALIISYYYVSGQVNPKPVKCYPESKCRSISWPKFDGSQRWQAQGLFDRMFSICVDLPQRVSRPVTDGGPGLRLITPYFVVKNNRDAIPIEMTAIYYRGGTSCSVNGGRASGPPAGERTLSVMGAGTFFQCYNREANNRPGSDANGIPVYCGIGGGGSPGVVTVGIQGQGAKAPGGKDNDKNGPGSGQDNTPDAGSGGGGSGSTANQQDDAPSPIPSQSPRGNKKEQPETEPSPFFDGRAFEPGSDPVSQTLGATTIAGQKIANGWLYLLGALPVLGTAGFFGWQWWRHKK